MKCLSKLKNSPLNWLLGKEHPSVRYFALKFLLDKPEDDPEVREARTAIPKQGFIQEVLDQQNADGSWGDAKKDIWTSKNTRGTLYYLSEFGIDRSVFPSLDKAWDFCFQMYQVRATGAISALGSLKNGGQASRVANCYSGMILSAMLRMGYGEDVRAQRIIDCLVEQIQPDGLIKCMIYDAGTEWRKAQRIKSVTDNCFMGTIKALKAFSQIPETQRSPKVQACIQRSAEAYLDKHIFRYRRTPKGEMVGKPGYTQFAFPFNYYPDILEILGVLTDLGHRNDPRMEEAVQMVIDKQDPHGRWLLERGDEKWWVPIEKAGQPSKWITLSACKMLEQYFG